MRLSPSSPHRGFSLLDLLVSMAVMGVLLSILSPALVGAQESARRVRCGSNVRQLGLAVQSYSYEHRDFLPPISFANPETGRSGPNASAPTMDWASDTKYVRVGMEGTNPRSRHGYEWDGLGSLFPREFLDQPEILYCPSHQGENTFSNNAKAWATQVGVIATNYQYRIPPQSQFLNRLDPRTSFISDAFDIRSDYSHVKGNNFLRADLSVAWYLDSNGELYNSLPFSLEELQHGQSTSTEQPTKRTWNILDEIDSIEDEGEEAGG